MQQVVDAAGGNGGLDCDQVCLGFVEPGQGGGSGPVGTFHMVSDLPDYCQGIPLPLVYRL